MTNHTTVQRVLNNNVVVANQFNGEEVILIGKGIGFGKKKGEQIAEGTVEKVYRLEDASTQEQYKQLLPQLNEEFIVFMNHIMHHIETRMESKLNEHVHIALTDHIAFAVKRLGEGLDFKNPFLLEIQSLYPKEYEVAEEVVRMIDDWLGYQLPDGEIGFIAIHIHSAITDKKVAEINQNSELIQQLTTVIEGQLFIQIDRQSVDYHRLVQHLRRAIERAHKQEGLGGRNKLDEVLKEEYPLCYNLSWKLIKIMQQKLQKPVDEAEAIYLTIHLQRLIS
ncbi:glucose PTS transporter transcription antiterminator GlcT [Pontibacillus litoralis]|uniref:PtsGHI operon antiterminator n=1 Tax=Pontibacillus litoralis JSM 072002 TaxID=1385512 RepID=A0A0A5G4S7_9BACI|nr:PRD domain-containing protein [Pontibacillus litoralis]KGX88126.1 PtsGHI operon antiterminator [Pontibacillus litoralis JSM 072002]